MLSSSISLDDFTIIPRTAIQLPNGDQQELQDEWDTTQTKVEIPNGEQWQGFTDICLQNKREGCRPRQRIDFTKYEAEYKGEDHQRKVRKCMQQGLADKDMDFTPGKWFMG